MNIARTNPLTSLPGERAGERAPAAARRDAVVPTSASSLWEVLTPEEREFFAQQQALGPLTYRRGGAPASDAPAPTGRRIDVRG
jgi:hypothetical protein